MFGRVRPRLDHPTVVAYLALATAIGGTSYAAVRIDGRDLKNRSVSGAKLKKRTITAVNVRKHALTVNELSASALSSLKGAQGDPGATGAKGDPGAKGDTGPRGPSDVFEAVQSNSSVSQTAGGTLAIELKNLPAGSYAIYAKASIGPLTNNPGRDTGQCTLSAGSDQDRGIDDWEAGEQSFKTIDTALTHSFAATGTVRLACTMSTENFLMGTGGINDTRIVAVRVDSATSAGAQIG
jgi:hypothetical protein